MGLLEQHFDVAFAAPDGIKKLRELILTLAMQGKLVPQDPNDEPASELLRSIELEKQRLVKEGKIRQPKPLPEINLDEVPYEVPEGWKWVRLGCVGAFERGRSKHRPRNDKRLFTNGLYPFVQTGDVSRSKFTNDEINSCSSYYNDFGLQQSRLWSKGTLCITIAANIAETGFLSIEACIPDSVVAFLSIDECLSKIVKVFIDVAKQDLEHYAPSTAQKNINLGIINDLIFPLPPLAEQRRIVAKIDQLMARCDELEKLRIDRSQRLLTVHTAALDRLLTAKDSSEFSTAWSFITQHFGELYSVKENVVELRKTILQLAVMGKLVRQDPNDEPASIQFKDIRQKIDDLVRRKVDKEVKFKCINAKDEAFLLPDNWLWVRLGSLLQSLKYGTSKKCEYNYPGTAVLRIPNIDVDRGCIDMEKIKYTELLESELQELYLKPNDLLIIRSNGSLSLVGRTAVISEAEEGLAYAGYLVRLRSLPEYVYSRYLYFALNTVSVRNQIEQPIRSTSGVKNINSTEIANISIPFPPLAEQRRIVEKIDRLMGMCDRLEESIESGKGKQTDLLNALMSRV
jgi:type I restriction enzyme, S subunit